jgi:hypothetical protein
MQSIHKVTYSNTRNAKSRRIYRGLSEDQILLLIKEQHSLDNGVRVISVYHSDGSSCPSFMKVGA